MTLLDTAPIKIGSGRANEIVLKHLGEVAIDASRLEHLAAEVAHGVKLTVAPEQAVDKLQHAKLTPPPWGTASAKDVKAWATSVARLLDLRTRMFSASGGARFSGSRGDTITTEASDGTLFPADEEYLNRLLHRLERQIAAGTELLSRLDYHDENGQRWPLVQLYEARADEQDEDGQPSAIANLPTEWRRWLTA